MTCTGLPDVITERMSEVLSTKRQWFFIRDANESVAVTGVGMNTPKARFSLN